VDAVYIATPVFLHSEQTVEAAQSGKHVLCEKPMALDVAECDRMITACTEAGVKLGVAYYRHLYPLIQRIRRIVADGSIGKPVLARIEAFERFNPQPGADRYWLLEPEKSGGGPMMDFGCHRIEILLDVLGAIERVSATHKNVLFERRVEDTTLATFNFTSGAIASLACTHAAIEPRDTFDLYCTEGSLHVESLNTGKLTVVTPSGVIEESHAPASNLHQPLIDDFVDSVLDDRAPGVDGNAGREVTEILDQIYLR
jgi:predicted dehydrogenase